MRALRLLGLSCILSAATDVTYAAEPAVRAGVIETQLAPYIIHNAAGQASSGIDLELPKLLASAMSKPVTLVFLSRKRLQRALQDGSIDLACGLDRRWLDDSTDQVWSGSLYQSRDLIVSRYDQSAPNSLTDLHGSRIGTLTGYIYPNLDDEFSHGKIRREDSNSAPSLIKKLIAGRLRHIVTSDIVLFYLLRQSTNPTYINPQVLTLDSNKIECVAKPGDKFSAEEFFNAVEKLRLSKAIDKVLANYR